MKPYLISITGPSCAGKTTLERMLRDRGMAVLVSTTTRTPRAGEKDGVAYDFVTTENFNWMKEAGLFVEAVEFNGHQYGVTAIRVRQAAALGKPIVLVCEPNGARQIKAYCKQHDWNHGSIFMTAPHKVIMKRFLNRMLSDPVHFNTNADREKFLDTHASRLVTMTTEERNWGGRDGIAYDLEINTFNETNDDMVCTAIVSTVMKAMKKDKPLRLADVMEFKYFAPVAA